MAVLRSERRTETRQSALEEYIERVQRAVPRPSHSQKVIYTTLFGTVDSLKQPTHHASDWDVICVTNRHDMNFGAWTPLFIDELHRDARRTARIFKILPWLLFPEAEVSLFMDASIRLTGSVDEFAERYCSNAALSCFKHPGRDCTYLEGQACIAQKKDIATTIEAQMKSYKNDHFPKHAGLIASGVLMRRHASEPTRSLMAQWIHEVERWSVRDQLSFNFAAWATRTPYNPIDLNIYNNKYFEVQPHVQVQRFDPEGRDTAVLSEKIAHQLMAAKRRVRLLQRSLIHFFSCKD